MDMHMFSLSALARIDGKDDPLHDKCPGSYFVYTHQSTTSFEEIKMSQIMSLSKEFDVITYDLHDLSYAGL